MELKDLQPIATILVGIIGGAVTAIIALKIQNKKRNDDIDLKAFDNSLIKRLKEFEQKLLKDNSYLSEKGKGLATKEDIEEITRKVESIKNEFVTPTEILKWELSKKANLYKIQAEKEFEVYTKLWDIITELRLVFEELHPSLDLQPVGTDFSKLWDKRLNDAREKRNNLLLEMERQRPFYSELLYFELRKLNQQSLSTYIETNSIIETYGKMTPEERKRGQKNLDDLVKTINNICNLIKSRIIES